jgi:hypothetical protein
MAFVESEQLPGIFEFRCSKGQACKLHVNQL